MSPEKRKRGAPKGNHNALKHGFYSSKFLQEDQFDFEIASGMEGVSEEIALIRFKIREAVIGEDTQNLMPLVKSALALEKLIRTDFKINGGNKYFNLKKGLQNAMRDIILPMGDDAAAIQAIKSWCGFQEPFANNVDQKTTDRQNEAGLP
jgi:hypothetical protein